MPFFGVEDVLFLLASTSPLLWIKRHELIELGVYGAVKAITHNASYASRCASRAVSEYRRTPILLLREININSNSVTDTTGKSSENLSSSSSSLPALTEKVMEESNVNSFSEWHNMVMEPHSLIRTGLAGSFRATPTRLPNVPHRFFDSKSHIPHVSYLAYCHELEVSKQIRQYSRVEVQTLFNTMEMEGMWESVVRVSRGIEMAHASMTYLSQLNIETALRTLFAHGPSSELAIAYYFSYSEDILPSDDILIALFDACRENPKASMDLYINLRPFRKWWTEVTYACCLSTLSQSHYAETIALYKEYLSSHLCQLDTNDLTDEQHDTENNNNNSNSNSNNDNTNKSLLLLSQRQSVFSQDYRRSYRTMWERLSRLRRRCCNQGLTVRQMLHEHSSRKLNYLYYIIVPLVAEHAPQELPEYVADMLRNDSEAAPDVFLKCLRCEEGRKLALQYLEQCWQTTQMTKNKKLIDNVDSNNLTDCNINNNQNSNTPITRQIVNECNELFVKLTFNNVVDIGFALYKLKPCAMNMNTLLEIVLWHCVMRTATTISPQLSQKSKSLLSPSAAAALGLNVANINCVSQANANKEELIGKTLVGRAISKSVDECIKTDNVCSTQELEESQIGKTLLVLLQEVSLREGVDSAILARTLTTFPLVTAKRSSSELSKCKEENHKEEERYFVPPWPILEAFMQAMLVRRELNVIPRLTEIAMRVSEYAYAARVMSIYLSNQRGALTSSEVNLCIEACVRAHKYESALFWLERARGQNLELTLTSRELAREAIEHSGSWQGALSLAACTLSEHTTRAITPNTLSMTFAETSANQQHKLLTTQETSLASSSPTMLEKKSM